MTQRDREIEAAIETALGSRTGCPRQRGVYRMEVFCVVR